MPTCNLWDNSLGVDLSTSSELPQPGVEAGSAETHHYFYYTLVRQFWLSFPHCCSVRGLRRTRHPAESRCRETLWQMTAVCWSGLCVPTCWTSFCITILTANKNPKLFRWVCQPSQICEGHFLHAVWRFLQTYEHLQSLLKVCTEFSKVIILQFVCYNNTTNPSIWKYITQQTTRWLLKCCFDNKFPLKHTGCI